MVRYNNTEHKNIIQRTAVVCYIVKEQDCSDNLNMVLLVIKTLMKLLTSLKFPLVTCFWSEI